MDLTSLIVALVLFVTLVYWLLTKNYNHWQKQNVPCFSNPTPGFGHMLPLLTLKESLFNFTDRIYKSTEASLIGFYFMRKPAILVRDPELVKSVMHTNFSSFNSNFIRLNEKVDPILANNPFFVEDPHKWKVTRARTTNNLTGKKLKSLFVIANNVCSKMTEYVERKVKENSGSHECELKDFFTRYTGEIVANAAFAIEGQSYNDNPDKTAFVNVVKNVFSPSFFNGLKQALYFYLPDVADLFGVAFFEKKTDNYLRHVVETMIKRRKEENNKPDDYLQFCIDNNTSDTEENIDSIIADVITFYGDVYETSSTTLANTLYLLSKNQEMQEKLRVHINSVLKSESNGIVTFECLKDLTYLDQIIQESMRLMPAAGALLKRCTEEITLEGPDGIKCHLHRNDPVFVPLMSLQLDEKHWPDSSVFDPERFSPENQEKRTKFAYLPFGEGPRMCVGMRLASMIMKLAIITLITKYKIFNSSKTPKTLELDPMTFLNYVKGGLWAKFEKL